MDVVNWVVYVSMFLEVEGRALNKFDERNDVLVVTSLLKSGEVLNLDSHCFSTLTPPKGTRDL